MYPLAIVGSDCSALIAKRACALAGFENLTWASGQRTAELPATTLSANASRVVTALGLGESLLDTGFAPDREQVRLAKSAFLVAELPLGSFYAERYGSALINIDMPDLVALLNDNITTESDVDSLTLERNHEIVISTVPPRAGSPGHLDYHLAAMPIEPAMQRANITWLAPGQAAWQFSTRRMTHYLFATRAGQPLDDSLWHPQLHHAIEAATESMRPPSGTVREHWYEGRLAHLGAACYTPQPCFREGYGCGFEDAWVLSRMLENYEEDITDGLREYQRYRAPRARKVNLLSEAAARIVLEPSQLARVLSRIKLAMSTRFLPEIAMSQRDWFHQYDCIKGFD